MMKPIQRRQFYIKDKNGMTMIEVLMAMTIFTVGFLAIGTMVIWTTRNNTTGNIVTQATMMARERIEFLKSLPIDEMVNQCLPTLDPEIIDQIYQRKCSVDTSHSATANIVRVNVSWNRRGKKREVELATLSRGNGT
jgi:prepilin-type N-terminal cleavage/methylation domain-containing protein